MASFHLDDLIFFIFRSLVIPSITFMRHDFGERYFTRSVFMAGLFILILFNTGSIFSSFVGSGAYNPPLYDPATGQYIEQAAPINWDGIIMLIITVLYILLSIYHTLTIWWRNSVNSPLHSTDHGLTRLEPIGQRLIAIPDSVTRFFIRIYVSRLPADKQAIPRNPSITFGDSYSFAEWIAEPLLMLLLGFVCSKLSLPSVSAFFYFSFVAVAFENALRRAEEKEKYLDWRDRIIESKGLSRAVTGESDNLRLSSNAKQIIGQVALQVEESPRIMNEILQSSPSIAEAMEVLNPKLKAMMAKSD